MSETMKKKEGAVIRTMPFHAPILLCGIFITVILSGIYLYRTEYILKENAKHLAKLYAERFETVTECHEGGSSVIKGKDDGGRI